MSDLHHATEIYVTAGEGDMPLAEALGRALGRRARVAVRGRFEPGADASAETARALEGAGVFVVLLSQAGALDAGLRGEVAALLPRVQRDPSRKVVPIYLDDAAERDRGGLLGLGIYQGIRRYGLLDVADALAATVRSLRTQWQRRASVAVVAVSAELGLVQASVVRRLRPMMAIGELVEVDAAAEGAEKVASAADFIVVLLGGRTGGTDVIARLVDAGAGGLKSALIDPDLTPPDEYAAARAVRIRVTVGFSSADEAAARAQELFDAWLRVWLPREPGKGALLEPWERAYLDARFGKWQSGSYGGLSALAGRRKLDRARLYVPLRATADGMHVDSEGRVVFRSRGVPSGERAERLEPEAPEGERKEAPVGPFLEQLVAHPETPYLVVEGEAGAGKTVLLQHVAYTLACRHLGEAPPPALLDFAALEAGAPLLRIPLLIDAARIADHAPRGEAGELTSALTAELQQATGDKSIDERAIAEGLLAGRYLLLVDSLDEVPGREGRERVAACLTAVARLRWPCRLVLTARPTAQTGVQLDERLRLAHVASLDQAAIERMVERWSTAMGEDDTYRTDLLEAVVAVATRHPAEGDSSLVANPLLLTCTMLVFDQQRLLPDSAAALFERMVTLLCDAKRSPAMPSELKREALERVFSAIQEGGGTSRSTREIADELLTWKPALRTVDGALGLLDQLAVETGLLRFETVNTSGRRSVRVARPWHRSFQQFLSACRLGSAADSVVQATDRLFEAQGGRLAPIDDPAWNGVLGFLLGVHAHRGSDRARAYVERLLERATDEASGAARRGRVLGLAAQGLAENPDVLLGDPLRDEVRQAVAARFAAEGERWPLADRLLALEALGRLGDPRIAGDPWVEIESGTFTMGDGESFQSVVPRETRVAAFRLFSRPATVQDYAAFVDADGYREPRWWVAGGEQEGFSAPEDWSAQRFHPNRPVVGVSWYEAMAFCAWAREAWGLEVDLPAEAEWEFAARGAEGRIYAWGNDVPGRGDDARANYQWGDILGTVDHATPVGSFPLGCRRGLLDLMGNVWEWCRDPWTKDGRPDPVDAVNLRGAPRVVRGGSWSNPARYLRCANRFRNVPGLRSDDLGFRVVCRGSRQP